MTRATASGATTRADDRRPPLVVTAGHPDFRERARAEASRLGLPFADGPCADGLFADRPSEDDAPVADLALLLDERGWALVDPRPRAPGAVRVDLFEGDLGERLRAGTRGEVRLARALGLRRHPTPLVLDATAGLGRESVLAAAMGCHVIACERSPAVALLLRDGLERAAALGGPDVRDLVARIDLRVADAREVLRDLSAAERPDVVLVDPMFPHRKKAAAQKKEMQLLQRLLGPEAPDEAPVLLAAALAAARRRVVVKRPAHAPAVPLEGRSPDLAVAGRAARYDVYLVAPGPVAPGPAADGRAAGD